MQMSVHRSVFFPSKLLGWSTSRGRPLVVAAIFVLLMVVFFIRSVPQRLHSMIKGEGFGQRGRIYATEEWEPPPEWDSTEAVYNNFARLATADNGR